ncbi:MAG: hypothetical protein J6Y97_07440 [Prevotella sp.]|nr:hypothetical protein [Prevotella sp.]
MMTKIFTKLTCLSLMVLGIALVSCTDKGQKGQQGGEPAATETDSQLVVAADNNLKAHHEDIVALWESLIGEDKAIAKYALAKDYVFLSTENGKEGLLLSFYKDMKDIDNFDGLAVCEGQQLAFQGDALVVKEKSDEGDKVTYLEKTERSGFNPLFTMTEKDGKKTFTDEFGEPYDEKEAQAFIDKISQEKEQPLMDALGDWNVL